MVYHLEIKETAESKPLIEHLLTLKYVKVLSEKRKPLSETAIRKAIKQSEKSKKISWTKAKEEMASWK